MATLSAFIGRSFSETDQVLWRKIEGSLDSMKRVGFSWEDAEEAQPKSISDKVRERIEKNDIFIGILTKREPICSSRRIRIGKRYHLLARTTNYLTSYWVIQESGYAMGKGKKVIFLIEDGLNIPGALNADFEYITIDRRDLLPAMQKLNEIIANEVGAKIQPLVAESRGEGVEATVVEQSETEVQDQEPPEFVSMLDKVGVAIAHRDYSSAEEMFKRALQELTDEETKKHLQMVYYQGLYMSGRAESLSQLKKIVDGNPEDYDAVRILVECLEFYDKYEEAKETIKSHLERTSEYSVKLKLSLLLSEINIKRKEFEQAKDNLSGFLEKTGSNSDEQNFSVYKALGDIYKEQKELDMSCSIYEMALKYNPTVLSLRFKLAYDYNTIEKYALSAYHYEKYLKTKEDAAAMNNLGVAYESLGLLGQSAQLFKSATEGNNTLAAANLAKCYIEKGFYDHARNVLTRAVEREDHHQNVDSYLDELKTSVEREEKEKEKILEDAREQREFMLDFAQAISIPFGKYNEIDGLWVTTYKNLGAFQVKLISLNTLKGEYESEYSRTDPYSPTGEPQDRIKKVTFSGTMVNRGLKYSISASSCSKKLPYLSREEIPEFSGLAIFSVAPQ